jgi:hypothetical protein
MAVSALGAAYSFTRPPELVWWSETIGDTKQRVRLLMPVNWEANAPMHHDQAGPGLDYFVICPVDRRPRFLGHFLHRPEDGAYITVTVTPLSTKQDQNGNPALDTSEWAESRIAVLWKRFDKVKLGANIVYERRDYPAFNRTYRQICDSLTIE